MQVSFRVAKIHGMPYLYTSFSAKSPIHSGCFVERDLQPMRFRYPVGVHSVYVQNQDKISTHYAYTNTIPNDTKI